MAEKQYQPPKKIEAIEGLDVQRQKVQLDSHVDSVSASEANLKVKFDEALEKISNRSQNVAAIAEVETTKKPSLLDIAATKEAQKTPSVQSIQNQAADLRSAFERPRAILMESNQAGIKLPESDILTLNGHIDHADQSLRSALSTVKGVEIGSLVPQDKPPMVKFLQFLTDGDHRVSTMMDDITKLTQNGRQMSPQILLAVQLKIGFVQQELEFFTNVMNKSIESIKTTMNVQI